MNNVIDFIKFKERLSHEEEEDQDSEYMREVDYIVERIWAKVLEDLVRSGCDFNKDIPTYFPSMLLILESIRSLYLQSQDIEHSLQEFAADALDASELAEVFKELVDNSENVD